MAKWWQLLKRDARDADRPESSDPMTEIGVSGLDHYGGYVEDDFLQAWMGEQRARTINEMRSNDPMVWAVLFAIEMLLRAVKWTVAPADKDQQSQDDADFLLSCMEDLGESWHDFISEVLDFIPHGFSLFEEVYKVRITDNSKHPDGRVGWKKLAFRAPETILRWDFADNGEILGAYQTAPPQYVETYIPLDKCLLFRSSVRKGNPLGVSMLRGAYRPWKFKKTMEETEGIGVERDLTGVPLFKVPARIMHPEATAADKAMYAYIQEMGRRLRRGRQSCIVVPTLHDAAGNIQYEVSLLATGGRRQIDTGEIITRYDQRIAMTVLMDFILLGHEKVGSFALSSDKTAMAATALGAWIQTIRHTLNTVAVPRLFELNGRPLDGLPTFEVGDIEKPDMAKLAVYVRDLANAGFLNPDDETEDHLRTLADLPPMAQHLKEE